jgi:RNA polymerase sigma-70 factor (ECF subfamily)
MEQIPDTVLIDQVRASDARAYRILFERYQPMLFRQVLVRVHDADVARDIVQETFLRIWERRGRLDPRLSFPGLSFRIASNLARDHHRQRQTRERLAPEVPPPLPSERDDPGESLSLTLLEEEMQRVLNEQVPERSRTILLLSRFERLSNQEIAQLLGISAKTVENQITRGLGILKKHLRHFLPEGVPRDRGERG